MPVPPALKVHRGLAFFFVVLHVWTGKERPNLRREQSKTAPTVLAHDGLFFGASPAKMYGIVNQCGSAEGANIQLLRFVTECSIYD